MKKFVPLLICIITFQFNEINAQIIRPFTTRFTNPSVRGSIVYVANSIVSTSGVGSGSPGTGEAPPGGSTTNNAGVGINIDVDNPAPTVKIPFGSVWSYHANNTAPPNDGFGNTWKQAPYVLNGPWNIGGVGTGAAKYGYSSGQATCLPSGQAPVCAPAAGNKFTSYYFRRNVSFTALELSTTFYSIQLNLVRDDGIVVYVNGVERIRDNMPAGGIVYGTLASANIAVGAAENVSYNLSPAFFNSGANTISVEVHLRAAASADMSFDMQVAGLDNNGTFNSSKADLNLGTCSNILFAGLYWGAGEGSNTGSTAWITGETTCKLKIPGAGTYTTITSTQNDYHNPTLIPGYSHTGYKCFKDITSLLNATNPNGTYTVANVLPPLGIGDAYGGWTIVIVYGNPSLLPRNLTVFDGNAAVKSGSGNVDVNISGFLTPPAGAVSCELGAVVYDGDRTSTDAFSFKQAGAPTFYDLTPTVNNPTSNLNDMWNSVIAFKGVVVTTRNPAFQNTLGYDANIINLPNALNAQLGNSKTGATVRFSSPSENYIVQVLTTAISQYNPSFSFDKTSTDINGGALVPGDSLRYQMNYTNVGNDAATNSVIIDNIPAGTTYLPGSLKINGVAKTDGSGDDQTEYDLINNRVVFRLGTGANSSAGGTITTGTSGNVQFDVIVSSSCKVLSCVGSITNSARFDYKGQTSLSSLFDSSGITVAGCIVKAPVVNTTVGPCFTPSDTLLINWCPATNLLIPWRKYAGYIIYSAQPFIPANIYNALTSVTTSHVYWAYFNNGAGCSDTVRINMIITNCPDIDDDNDGIPDYVEFNDVRATQDANSNGIPNWNDPAYPGYVDNNADNVNDNFDWGADADNDGIPNFQDTDFWITFVDVNGDGINDKSDKDLDGIPNQYDLDSDNDGIPDVVESYGVDTNGDGVIDNYIDTDNDGFSQNVDANNTGVNGSGVGLGAQDLDGDGVPNYLDLDSDNDGIPDVTEAGGTDANNDGMTDGYGDMDGDGFSDNVDGDVGNDGVAENSANALLRTGPDTSPVNGRADSYPYKNMDNDGRANPYDCDSDGDGIADVIESGLPDVNKDGWIDGPIGTNGWSTTVSAMPALNLRNTDGRGNPDYLDIDADDDGIPDNIEGMATASYLLPSYLDTDNDGLDDRYDSRVGFGGPGIDVYDNDSDGIPDYRDLDTDADGIPDIVEGNDFNRNGIADDNVTLTLLDTDGDGLDNRFDSLTSVTNIRGTSYNMGNGGSTTGEVSPGGRTPVQKTNPLATDRDWRSTGAVLNVKLFGLSGILQKSNALINWEIITTEDVDHFEIERSTNNGAYITIAVTHQAVSLNELQSFDYTDNTYGIVAEKFLYRVKIVTKSNRSQYSNVYSINRNLAKRSLTISPNPAIDYVNINFYAERNAIVDIRLLDNNGKTILLQKQPVNKGNNIVKLIKLNYYVEGVYSIQMILDGQLITEKLVLLLNY